MRDMDVLGRELQGHALRQATQRELAHGEGRGLGIALHAGRSAGEEDAAFASPEHPLGRFARHQKPAIGGDAQRFLHLSRNQLGEGPARAVAGVIDREGGRSQVPVERAEQRRDRGFVAGVAAIDPGAGFRRHGGELAGIARGQRQSGAQTRTRADDQRRFICHPCLSFRVHSAIYRRWIQL
jgi:hypothetical protein